MDANIVRLIIVVLFSVIWNVVIIYLIGLNRSEKALVKRGVQKILIRKND